LTSEARTLIFAQDQPQWLVHRSGVAQTPAFWGLRLFLGAAQMPRTPNPPRGPDPPRGGPAARASQHLKHRLKMAGRFEETQKEAPFATVFCYPSYRCGV